MSWAGDLSRWSTEERRTAVPHSKRTPERLGAFSDDVFAVLITVR